MRKKVYGENRCAATVFASDDGVFIMKDIVTFEQIDISLFIA